MNTYRLTHPDLDFYVDVTVHERDGLGDRGPRRGLAGRRGREHAARSCESRAAGAGRAVCGAFAAEARSVTLSLPFGHPLGYRTHIVPA